MHLIELYSEQNKYGNLVQKLIYKRLIKLIFYEFYPASWSGSRYRVKFEEKRCWCFPKLYFYGFLSHCVRVALLGTKSFVEDDALRPFLIPVLIEFPIGQNGNIHIVHNCNIVLHICIWEAILGYIYFMTTLWWNLSLLFFLKFLKVNWQPLEFLNKYFALAISLYK